MVSGVDLAQSAQLGERELETRTRHHRAVFFGAHLTRYCGNDTRASLGSVEPAMA
jgi:hypothetical protein